MQVGIFILYFILVNKQIVTLLIISKQNYFELLYEQLEKRLFLMVLRSYKFCCIPFYITSCL